MNCRFVSIIIPVYNSEKYLDQCINSVISQTYKELEILLINDGSEDKSGAICDAYAKKDKRIKVFHIDNSGVSSARNLGLLNATGTYIQFVDSDDTIKPDMTQCLVDAMEHQNADMVVCGYDRISRYLKHRDKYWEKVGTYTNKEYLVHTLKDPTGYYYGVIWNKLYKKEPIVTNSIYFEKELNLGEDFIFNLEYLKHINSVYVIHKRLYNYNNFYFGSLSRYNLKTVDMFQKEIDNRIIIFDKYKDSFAALGMYEKYKKIIYTYWKNIYLNNMYVVKFGFKKYGEPDKDKWRSIFVTNEEIQKCAKEITKAEEVLQFTRIRYRTWLCRVKVPLKKIIIKIRG